MTHGAQDRRSPEVNACRSLFLYGASVLSTTSSRGALVHAFLQHQVVRIRESLNARPKRGHSIFNRGGRGCRLVRNRDNNREGIFRSVVHLPQQQLSKAWRRGGPPK